MKNFVLAAILGIGMATSAVSGAQAVERWPGWYLGLSAGYTYMLDEDISGGTSATRLYPDNGYGLGGSIGFLSSSSLPVLDSMRFEAEVTYHHADIRSVKVSGVTVPGNGSFASTAYMANAFYDLPTESAWSPYIGGGIGLAYIHMETNSGVGNTSSNSSPQFAWQGMAGIGYSPSSVPNTQWTLGYRYLATNDPEFSGTGTNVITSYSTHNLELGAKFRF